MLLKFHVAVVESLIVTTVLVLHVLRIPIQSNPKPELRAKGVQSPPQQRNRRGGVGMQEEGYHHRPYPRGRIPWGGERGGGQGGCGSHASYIFSIYIYTYVNK